MTSRTKILLIIASLALLALALVIVVSQTDLLASFLGRDATEAAQDDPSGTVLIEATDSLSQRVHPPQKQPLTPQ